MGCSRTKNQIKSGCQPVDKPCNPIVLLQLSTNTRAIQCYCNEDGCNGPSDIFKIIVGGYLVSILGIFGILGNILAFVVLSSLKKKRDVDIILAGIFSYSKPNLDRS